MLVGLVERGLAVGGHGRPRLDRESHDDGVDVVRLVADDASVEDLFASALLDGAGGPAEEGAPP